MFAASNHRVEPPAQHHLCSVTGNERVAKSSPPVSQLHRKTKDFAPLSRERSHYTTSTTLRQGCSSFKPVSAVACVLLLLVGVAHWPVYDTTTAQEQRQESTAAAPVNSSASSGPLGVQGGQPFFFLHIPKTGGKSFLHSLNPANITWKSGMHGCSYRHLHRETLPQAERCTVDQAAVQVWSEESKSLAEALALDRQHGGGRRLAVMARDPVAHVSSQYYHCTESPSHTHAQGTNMPGTIGEWVRAYLHAPAGSPAIGNFHCYDPRCLQTQRAGTDLSKFAFVGITEDMPRSVRFRGYARICANTVRGCIERARLSLPASVVQTAAAICL